MVVAVDETVVPSEPVLDDRCTTFHATAGQSVILKALQQVADIRKEEGHDSVAELESLQLEC